MPVIKANRMMLAFALLTVDKMLAQKIVQWSEDSVADGGGGRIARLAGNIIRESEANLLMDVIASLKADAKHLDSTDGLPAFETYVLNHGKGTHPLTVGSNAQLAPMLERMTAFARRNYECPACHLCSVLLRRYMTSERVRVHSHFDRNAIVTAVISLNGGFAPPAFEGGFFLQRTARASSREFLKSNRTSAVFHSYDLNHGVELLRGTRYSSIFWWSDTEESCREGTSPWYNYEGVQ